MVNVDGANLSFRIDNKHNWAAEACRSEPDEVYAVFHRARNQFLEYWNRHESHYFNQTRSKKKKDIDH